MAHPGTELVHIGETNAAAISGNQDRCGAESVPRAPGGPWPDGLVADEPQRLELTGNEALNVQIRGGALQPQKQTQVTLR